PRAVLIDTDVLATLPDRELHAGLAEVIKYGAIRDEAFFAWLEDSMPALLTRDASALGHAIETSCAIKAEIVAADERESGERALLNFGHTFGHAIESASGYGEWLHGEAVAAGMALAARFSAQRGRLPATDVDRLVELLRRLRLPVDPPRFAPDVWLDFMGRDKKNEGGRITLVLLD